jgi:hypothetical protein
MNRTDKQSIDIVIDHSTQAHIVDEKDIEALEVKFSQGHHISISSDEAQLLRAILHEHAKKASNKGLRGSPPSRLIDFASVLGIGASTGVLGLALFPTQPMVSIAVAIVATIAAKLALPWINRR